MLHISTLKLGKHPWK